MDSELVVKHLNKQYRLKAENLRPYYETVKFMAKTFDSCKFSHVMREENKEADKLSQEAITLDTFSYILRSEYA